MPGRHPCCRKPALSAPKRSQNVFGKKTTLCVFTEPEKSQQGSLGTESAVQRLELSIMVFASDLAVTLCHGLFRPLKFTGQHTLRIKL